MTFSEESGVRYLHFGTEWVQGAMRLRKPEHIELEYAQQMMAWLLFIETPARIVQLGFGAAALTKFCYRFLNRAKVEAVELNPAVVIAARAMFGLPYEDARLTVTERDVWEFVSDRSNHGTTGALQIDIYDATARGSVLDSVSFYRTCRACLTPEAGVVTINLFGEHISSSDKTNSTVSKIVGNPETRSWVTTDAWCAPSKRATPTACARRCRKCSRAARRSGSRKRFKRPLRPSFPDGRRGGRAGSLPFSGSASCAPRRRSFRLACAARVTTMSEAPHAMSHGPSVPRSARRWKSGDQNGRARKGKSRRRPEQDSRVRTGGRRAVTPTIRFSCSASAAFRSCHGCAHRPMNR
ncbi:MAG: Spermidine synthase-like protein [uncultured Caballeronia sp.]|nr:MAG: Spermidine synthase-like protein [uncultured Caballeronia sp.]